MVNCEIEKTDKEYAAEMEELDDIFPNAKFSIAIDIDELDDIITEQNNIVVQSTYNCYCYDDCKRKTDFFRISGNNMTNRFVLSKLIEQGLNLECNHIFVEGFNKIPNTNCQYEIITGS